MRTPYNTYFLIAAGVIFLLLSKLKYLIHGYATPRDFDLSEVDRAIDYDIGSVNNWLKHLGRYTNKPEYYKDKSVLELGPGSELGTGIYLLSKGCAKYSACDINNLAGNVPNEFYEQFLERLAICDKTILEELRKLIANLGSEHSASLNYYARRDLDIAEAVGRNSIDLVFSQAAFEHFVDVEKTIEQLSMTCRKNAVAVISVDLMTHSRWIRKVDPNNIYRFPSWFYRIFWYPGIPNRVRPWQYRKYFEENGWTNITVEPEIKVSGNQSSYEGVHNTFADTRNRMEWLSVVICATKA